MIIQLEFSPLKLSGHFAAEHVIKDRGYTIVSDTSTIPFLVVEIWLTGTPSDKISNLYSGQKHGRNGDVNGTRFLKSLSIHQKPE